MLATTRREPCSSTTWAAKDSRLLDPPDIMQVSHSCLDISLPHIILLRWIVFCQCRQHASESVHHYIPDQRGLTRICKFGELEYELVTGQIAEHTNNPKVREKLLISADDLTLAKAVEIVF